MCPGLVCEGDWKARYAVPQLDVYIPCDNNNDDNDAEYWPDIICVGSDLSHTIFMCNKK
jgi:hypothetical protein